MWNKSGGGGGILHGINVCLVSKIWSLIRWPGSFQTVIRGPKDESCISPTIFGLHLHQYFVYGYEQLRLCGNSEAAKARIALGYATIPKTSCTGT